MEVILSAVREKVREYGNRRRDVIYAHHLDKVVWVALDEPEGVPESLLENEYVLIGELIHRGVSRIVFEASPKCKRVYLPRWLPSSLDERVAERWVKQGEGPYVLVCGNADGFVEYQGRLVPLELKTTRRPNGRYPEEWFRRTETYAWLYEAPVAILAVLDLANAAEYDYVVRNPGEPEMQERITSWLQGRYPKPVRPLTAWG